MAIDAFPQFDYGCCGRLSLFALSYDPKVSQLMEELAMPGWIWLNCQMTNLISQTWLEHYANDPRRANPVFGRSGADAKIC